MAIEQAIDVDTNVISFGKFMPGKMLGSTLVVSNISKHEQIVEIAFDSTTEEYERSVVSALCHQDVVDELEINSSQAPIRNYEK